MKSIKIILLSLLLVSSGLSVNAQDSFSNISGLALLNLKSLTEPVEKETPKEAAPSTNTLAIEHQSLVNIAPCQVYSFATITFNIPEEGAAIISIHETNGNKVKTIVSDTFEKGEYTKVLRSRTLGKGTFYIKLEMEGYTETKKLTVVH